ncbi:hypothetical protein VTK26DRAFT_3615 [Humicola hyalothermophila]
MEINSQIIKANQVHLTWQRVASDVNCSKGVRTTGNRHKHADFLCPTICDRQIPVSGVQVSHPMETRRQFGSRRCVNTISLTVPMENVCEMIGSR